jgi:hypothetical protein
LSLQLLAFRQGERRSRSDGAVDRDAQAIGVHYFVDVIEVRKRLQRPRLMVAAIAIGKDGLAAVAWRLTVETKPAGGQGAASLGTPRLVGRSGAVCDHQLDTRSILGSRNIDAPIGICGREYRPEGIVLNLALGAGRTARQSKHDCGDYDRDACLIVGQAAGENGSADRLECVQHAILPMMKVNFSWILPSSRRKVDGLLKI